MIVSPLVVVHKREFRWGISQYILKATHVDTWLIHYNLFVTRFIITQVLDITQFKDGSQKCIDYIEK